MPIISAIQMCSSHIVDENLATAASLIREAAGKGANLVVLPEMFAIMGEKATDKVVVKEEFGSGKIQDFLADQARINKVWLVGGTIPISCADSHKVSAACLVYDDKGALASRYDKIHLFDVTVSDTESYKESATTYPGDKVVVIPTPFGKLGLSVCYDIRFPELYRAMFNMGAEIIVIPSAFTVKTGEAHWELLARARAVENFCYVIGACQSGTHSSGRKTYGNSLIVEPWGNVSASLPEGVGVITASMDLDKLHAIRKDIPVAAHQRMYVDISTLSKSSADKSKDVSLTFGRV
ncbi:MAG: carbon-nitrogen hydrolase family protein [Gammaproteobacteria bacterium]|nr:carbon-nitrogen hydrolase family protein [Gammaproteobacteria bacterium]